MYRSGPSRPTLPLALSRRLALLAVGAAVAGCTLGPDPRQPSLPISLDSPYVRSGTEGDAAATRPTPAAWWRRFGDGATERLVERAVRGNADVLASAGRVAAARALLGQARADRLPSLSLNASRDRRKQSITLPAGIGGGGTPGVDEATGQSIRTSFLTTTYDLSADVSWQFDLWGRLRRAQQAARLELLATMADRQALLHTVVAETIRARVSVPTLQQRLRLARDSLQSLGETLRVTQTRYESGIGDPLSVRLARENVASAEAQIPPLAAQVRLAHNALSVLIGRRPGATDDLPDTLPPLPTLAPPPLALPARLLDQRPDLLASELRARAAQAQIGVAVADLYPNLTLSAGYGRNSSDIENLFDADAEVYNLLVGLVQPIFEGGRRRAALAAARARADTAAANYFGTVLTAIREVEDALASESGARAETEASARAFVEAQAAEATARDRYARGLAQLLDVFEAERRRRAAEERLALARQNVWDARIDLHLALGGDWDATTPATQPAYAEVEGRP